MTKKEDLIRNQIKLNDDKNGRKNYSIIAGAGAGKTTILADRISKQIAMGTPVEEFAVITYTNAAAAELRDKITTKLHERLNHAKDNEPENIMRAIEALDLMQISTIHSFLLKILKENALETGISLDVTMLEATEEELRKTVFFENWYEKNYSDIRASFYSDDPEQNGDWEIPRSDKSGVKEKTKEVLENMFMDIANVREDIVIDTNNHQTIFEKYAKEYVTDYFMAIAEYKLQFEKGMKLKPKNKNGSEKELTKSAEIIEAELEKYECATDDKTKAFAISEILKKLTKERVDREKKGKTLFDFNYYKQFSDPNNDLFDLKTAGENLLNVSTKLNTYGETYAKVYNRFFDYDQRVNKVADFVMKAREQYQQEIDSKTTEISNDDILYRSKKLLSENKSVLEKVRSQYSKIYIDEFQDTTGLQADIAKAISLKKGTSFVGSSNDLETDKLVVVGDRKQSIYRFSGAELSVYDSMNEFIDNGVDSEAVELDENFRSNKKIVNWVNDSFRKVMGSSYQDMTTDWEIQEESALHGVFRYENDSSEGDPADILFLIHELTNNNKFFIEEYDRETDKRTLRRIKYSDFMIITRNTTNMLAFAEPFAEAGIPLSIDGKIKVEDDEILKNYIILLEYLGNTKNKNNRFAAMQVLTGIDIAMATETEIARAKKITDKWRKDIRSKYHNIESISKHVLTGEKYYLPKNEEISNEKIREYRTRLYQMVENCIKKCDGDLMKLTKLMSDYMQTDVNRQISLENDEDAVKLMNVHKAKGLTGQIVIIADRRSAENCRYSGFKKAGKYYPSAWFKDTPQSPPTYYPSYTHEYDTWETAFRDEMEEAIRLQYVAATRGAHALIFMPPSNDAVWFASSEYSYGTLTNIYDWIEERKADVTEYDLVDGDTNHLKQTIKMSELKRNVDEVIGAEKPGEMYKPQLVTVNPSGLERKGSTGFSTKDEGYEREPRPQGNVFGTMLHKMFELYILSHEDLEKMGFSERTIELERIVNLAILESRDMFKKKDENEEIYSVVEKTEEESEVDIELTDAAKLLDEDDEAIVTIWENDDVNNKTNTAVLDLIKDYLMKVLQDYAGRIIDQILSEAASPDEIYPEFTFSFFVEDSEKEEFESLFAEYLDDESIKVNKGNNYWINGSADLVVKQKDGTIKIYDYKSDARNGKTKKDFDVAVKKKYEGQLLLYKYAMRRIFGTDDISAEIVDLYR